MNAIILAGGRGSRLAPWHAPKCLLPVNGVPMLHRLISQLRKWPSNTDAGGRVVNEVVVCTGYRATDVAAALCGWSDTVVHLATYAGDVAMGMRLQQARECWLKPGDRTLICYGDELADVDIDKLVAQHEREQRSMTFAAYQAKVPGGSVLVSEQDHVRIQEDRKTLVNIGFVVVEPQCWDLLQPEDGLSDWINRVAECVGISGDKVTVRDQRVGVYHHAGKRATINSLADIAAAEEIWR